MFTIAELTEFLGWSSVINIGFLLFASVLLMLMRQSVANIHSKMFGVDTADIYRAYFQYLANYKIAIIVLNLVPYISLKIMG